MRFNIKSVLKVIAASLVVALVVSGTATPLKPISTEAASYSELQKRSKEIEKELKDLQAKKKSEEAIQAKLKEQIKNTQAKIDACNAVISKYNAEINAKQVEIDEKQAEIADSKQLFRKRIRSIYMSGNASGDLAVLMGAEDFSDFLALSQLTSNMSNRDEKLIESITEAMQVIQSAQEEIKDKKAAQQSAVNNLNAEQGRLESQNSAILASLKKTDEASDKLESEHHKLQADMSVILNSMNNSSGGGGGVVNNTRYEGELKWPVPGCMNITSGWGQRWGSMHKGIDIAGGGIWGKPIVAVGDGVITKAGNSCTHDYGKNGSCGCGGGYGNYAYLNVRTASGNNYTLVYGHMKSCIVTRGQQVKAGQVIGYVGTTGWSTGPHLHYEVYKNGVNINPMSIY